MENETKKSKKEVLRNPIVKSICLVGVFTALMCVLSPLSIPLDPVSITLATLVIYIIGATFDYKIAVLPVVLYLLLGMAGLPVFSNSKAVYKSYLAQLADIYLAISHAYS